MSAQQTRDFDMEEPFQVVAGVSQVTLDPRNRSRTPFWGHFFHCLLHVDWQRRKPDGWKAIASNALK